MRLHRMILLGAGVVGVVVAVRAMTVEQVPEEAGAGPARRPEMADPVPAVQDGVDVSRTRIEQPRVVEPAPVEARGDDATAASPGSDRAPQPAAVAYQPGEIAERLDAHHAGERGDRAWSDKVQAELSATLGTQRTTTLSSVQCAASLCKVALWHDTADAQRELASMVASLPVMSAGVFYHYEEGADPPRTVLYVVREGHDIRELLAER